MAVLYHWNWLFASLPWPLAVEFGRVRVRVPYLADRWLRGPLLRGCTARAPSNARPFTAPPGFAWNIFPFVGCQQVSGSIPTAFILAHIHREGRREIFRMQSRNQIFFFWEDTQSHNILLGDNDAQEAVKKKTNAMRPTEFSKSQSSRGFS